MAELKPLLLQCHSDEIHGPVKSNVNILTLTLLQCKPVTDLTLPVARNRLVWPRTAGDGLPDGWHRSIGMRAEIFTDQPFFTARQDSNRKRCTDGTWPRL